MSVLTDLQLQHFFNYMAQHLHDDLKHFTTQTFTHWQNRYPDHKSYIAFNDNSPFTLTNFSKLLLKILNTYDFLKFGYNANHLVEKISKLDTSAHTWLSEELKQLCASKITTNTSANIDTEIVNDTVNSSLTPNNQNSQTSDLTDLVNNLKLALNASWEEKLNNLYAASLSVQVKDEHFGQLEDIIIEHTIASNNLTINNSYKSSNLYQQSICHQNFPSPWFKQDQTYVHNFNELIQKFQGEIQDLQSTYLGNKISTLDTNIKNKIDLISKFDDKAKEKADILFEKTKISNKSTLDAAINKITRIIENPKPAKSNNQSHNNQSNKKNRQITNHFTQTSDIHTTSSNIHKNHRNNHRTTTNTQQTNYNNRNMSFNQGRYQNYTNNSFNTDMSNYNNFQTNQNRSYHP